MIIKDCSYVNGNCVITFKDCTFNISIPIHDDPGFIPGDELIITETRIWKIIRYMVEPEAEFIIDDLPFPEVF